jgi:pimeloyl-ACP methyl ester carboxylesterase
LAVRIDGPVKARWVALGVGAAIGVGSVVERQLIRRERARAVPLGEADFVPPVTERTIETDDGGEIHVVERGHGPPIVLVHGITLAASIWGYQLRDLAATHRVIAIDQRGHGRSQPGREPAGLGRLGTDLLAVLEALDVRGAIVVGHSMGGMVVLRLAADRPEALSERVAGLVLVATSGGPVTRLPYWGLLAPVVSRLAGAQVRLSQRVRRGLLPAGDVSYVIARRAFGDRPEPSQVELTRAIIDATSPLVVADLLGDVMSVDVGAALEEVELPALVIVGSKDHLTPPWTARRLAAALPRAELLTLAGCGHMVMLERPRELAEALERFGRWCRRRELSA